jgi:hypothetical protein
LSPILKAQIPGGSFKKILLPENLFFYGFEEIKKLYASAALNVVNDNSLLHIAFVYLLN